MADSDLDYLFKFDNLIGCDEVGRGPIAGPVNSCAVAIESHQSDLIEKLSKLNVTDSKKLTDKKRKKILESLSIDVTKIDQNKIYENSALGEKFSFVIGEHSHEDIDRMNILQASLSAMKIASDKLIQGNTKILVDGNKTFDSAAADIEFVIKGDSKFVIIGLASIIAKVFRDEKMKALNILYPGYNLAKHAGYPTKEHRDAVKKLGPCKIHRKSFKGVKEYL